MARKRYGGRSGGPMERAREQSIGTEPMYPVEGAYFRVNGVMITAEEYKQRIYSVFQDTFRATREDVIARAADKVPVRTGQLLASVLESIDRWSIDNDNVHLEISTNVEYAYDIPHRVAHNDTWFEHDGSWAYAYYYGHSGHVYLNDPNAVWNWQMDLVNYTQTQWDMYYSSYQTYYGV